MARNVSIFFSNKWNSPIPAAVWLLASRATQWCASKLDDGCRRGSNWRSRRRRQCGVVRPSWNWQRMRRFWFPTGKNRNFAITAPSGCALRRAPRSQICVGASRTLVRGVSPSIISTVIMKRIEGVGDDGHKNVGLVRKSTCRTSSVTRKFVFLFFSEKYLI